MVEVLLKIGLSNDWYNVSSLMAEQAFGDYDVNQLSNDYVTFFLHGRKDSFDNAYIPTRGQSVGISYDWVFGGGPHKFNNFHATHFDAKRLWRRQVRLHPVLNIRYLVGDEVPVPFTNTIGGSVAGKVSRPADSFHRHQQRRRHAEDRGCGEV